MALLNQCEIDKYFAVYSVENNFSSFVKITKFTF